MINQIKNIRKSLPLPLRRGYGWVKRKFAPHWIWDTKEFQSYFEFLQKSQWWSISELEAYQLEQLSRLVKFSYEKVPYYKNSFDMKHIKPSDIKALEDLEILPIITKEEVRSHIDEFIPTDVDRSKLRHWVTGGSSGLPLSVYLDSFYSAMIEESFRLRQRMWAGYQKYDRRATLLRQQVCDSSMRKCWDYYNIENELALSSRDMTEKNMVAYIKLIQEFKPLFLDGYPSALEIFARHVIRNNIVLPPMKAIFSEAEALFPGQRALIESAFNTKVFSGYGMSEGVADATECDQHNGYHVSMEYGIFELVDNQSNIIKGRGLPGFVVGTGFHNSVMPLLRYQMFDVAVLSDEVCTCKRQAPIIKSFIGRAGEYFVGKSGKLVPLQLVWSGRHPIWSRIREMKYFQQFEGEVIANIVKTPQFVDDKDVKVLQDEIKKVLTEDEFKVNIKFVDCLPLTHRGKMNFLEQKINLDLGNIVKPSLQEN
jgi:phenylacetate-CoA ligase